MTSNLTGSSSLRLTPTAGRQAGQTKPPSPANPLQRLDGCSATPMVTSNAVGVRRLHHSRMVRGDCGEGSEIERRIVWKITAASHAFPREASSRLACRRCNDQSDTCSGSLIVPRLAPRQGVTFEVGQETPPRRWRGGLLLDRDPASHGREPAGAGVSQPPLLTQSVGSLEGGERSHGKKGTVDHSC